MLPSTMTAMVSQSPSLRTMPSAPRAQLIGAMFAPAQIHICCSPVESLSASGMGSMLWTSTLSSDPAAVAMRAPWPSGVVRSHRVVRNETETPARYCAGDGDAVKTDREPRGAEPDLRLRAVQSLVALYSERLRPIASVSNYGAYGVSAMLGFLLGDPDLVHDPDTHYRMLEANVREGASDGIYGRPIMKADGISVQVGQGLVRALREMMAIGLRTVHRPF